MVHASDEYPIYIKISYIIFNIFENITIFSIHASYTESRLRFVGGALLLAADSAVEYTRSRNNRSARPAAIVEDAVLSYKPAG